MTKLQSLSSPALCPAFPSPSQFAVSNDDDDEEQVIGDCLVFEDGIFEDPYLEEEQINPRISAATNNKSKSQAKSSEIEIEPQKLVPEEWERIVDEINLTKKERRKIAQEMEFGQRIQNKKRLRNVNLEEYLRFRNDKLSEVKLKPLVLDKPTHFPSKDDDEGHPPENTRVEPRNPRWAVYGRGFDDITEFFNSGNYEPSDDKPEGRQKLFTQEEKVLMNARMPKLAAATSQKWLPLHTLAASGEFYLLNALLKHNVDINASDQDGFTALHKAITCKKQAITNYLLRESSNPFILDKDGATLMHYAVRTASMEAIKTLLLHNVDINRQDNDGWTPLHVAVQARRTDVVRLLLMKGADKTVKNQDGLSPVELCLHCGRDTKTFELIKILKQLPRQHC